MDTIVAGEGNLDPIGGRSRALEQDEAVDRILEVSSWMMILGTARLICAFGAYVGSFLDGAGTVAPTIDALIRYLQDSPPMAVLGASWPLLLGLLLRRTRNRGFLLAAAITFFILSLGGALVVAARMLMRSDPTILFGSFEVSRWGLRHGKLASMVQALLGSVELALELATAVAAWSLAHAFRTSENVAGTPLEPKRRLQGRLAVYVSLAFVVLNVRIPLWSAYEEVLNRSSLVRELVLKSDTRSYAAYQGTFPAGARLRGDMELEIRLTKATDMAASNKVVQAKEAYLDIIARAEQMGLGGMGKGESDLKPQVARALNNLAWMLATCKDERLRRPAEALSYAKRSVTLAGEEGNYWNTLGVVWFRLENWTEAVKAFEQSMKLRAGEGDSYDWFFLAMIEGRRGHMEQGRQWYDRALSWSQQGERNVAELFRFQVEAAQVLGLDPPKQPEIAKARRPSIEGGSEQPLVSRKLKRATPIPEDNR